MRVYSTAIALSLLVAVAGPLRADDLEKTQLKAFNVTIRVFDPAKGLDYVLPVDSPDAEHAIASTLANAASFTKKTTGDKPLSIAFACVKDRGALSFSRALRRRYSISRGMERAEGIEPSYEAWEASVLPLNYARARSVRSV